MTSPSRHRRLARVLAGTVTLTALLVTGNLRAQQILPDLEPLPEPPVRADAEGMAADEVTILQRGNDTVTEYRRNGELILVSVTPAGGAPTYYLVASVARPTPHDIAAGALAVPMWVASRW